MSNAHHAHPIFSANGAEVGGFEPPLAQILGTRSHNIPHMDPALLGAPSALRRASTFETLKTSANIEVTSTKSCRWGMPSLKFLLHMRNTRAPACESN